jgi:hypothetical protein
MAWARKNTRRSSRVLFSVRIVVSGTNPETGLFLEAPGNTLVVNQHGALIRTIEGLCQGMEIIVAVPSRHQSARARIVWTNLVEGKYGIELETPCDLWGVQFPTETENAIAPIRPMRPSTESLCWSLPLPITPRGTSPEQREDRKLTLATSR